MDPAAMKERMKERMKPQLVGETKRSSKYFSSIKKMFLNIEEHFFALFIFIF